MLKNKIAISKNFLIAICFISLVLFAVNNVSAMDLNESGNYDKISIEDNGNFNINAIDEDKLGNSQENTLLQAKQMSLNGGKFSDIQNLIHYNLSDGDTIILDGEFKSDGANSHIIVYKNITFKSASKATLDARNLSSIFVVERGGSGSSFSNLILKNGNSNYGGAMWIYGKDVTIDNCEFEANYASKGGGAIYTHYDVNINSDEGRNLLIKNSKFKSNFACIAAGAVGAYGYNTRILNCSFQSNSVYNKNGGIVYGGAIQVGKEDFTSKALIKDCRFLNNKAISVTGTGLSHGGAACLRGGVTYENCLFEGNSADFGGALTAHQSGTIKDCSFVYNSANDFGGAIANGHDETSINLNIVGCSFSYNSAPYGAAARLAGYDVVIEDSNFATNIASIDGGAVYIKAKTLSIYDSNFKTNLAFNNGGAVYVNGESTTVQGSTFSGNMAVADPNVKDDGLGGAIYINGSSDNVRNNVFEYNVARNGSAIYYDNAGKDLTVTNNVMTQNQAWVYALPIYAKNIYYGEEEKVGAVIYGGNNIADYNNLAVSNAIYNAALNRYIKVNGETPVSGATNSGELYQDSREYNIDVLLTVRHSDGTVVYNNTLKSSYLGEVSAVLTNLKPGTYTVTATHYEDYYYKAITNQTTFVVTPKIDVAVSKSTTASQFNYQDSVVWTLSVTNNGPNDATGVKVNDALPAGLVYKSAVASVGRYSNGVWNIGNLAKGASATLKITTLINKTGDITNNANVVSNEFDWNDTNNKDSEKITVNRAADLQITKTSNVTNPKYGDLVKWTITVKNNGPDRATNVEVTDILPSGLALKNSPSNYQSGKWSVGTLNVGQSKSLEIITLVNKTGTIKNVASVNGSEYDHIPSNNKDDASVTVAKAADLGVSKSVNDTAPNYHDLVKWTIVVVNNGPDGASGVKVSDVLPAGLVYRSYTASVGSYSGGVWSVGGLAKGASATLEVTTLVNRTGSIKNSVSVTGNEYDYNPSNNKDDASVTVAKAADLGVSKSVNNTAPNYHDLVKWTIVVVNNGPDAASGVKVSDVLPAGLVYRSYTASVGSYSNGVWNIGNLAKGASATLEVTTLVNRTGSIKNSVSVTGNEHDYNPSNNKADKSINVKNSADLGVSKSVNNTAPNYRDLVKWTIAVRNNGPDGASGVKVSDVLPSGLVYRSAVASVGSYSNGVWNIGNLAKGASATLEVTTLVNMTGSIKNSVSVTGNEYDFNPSNNKDDASVTVAKAADLGVSKSVNNTAPYYHDLVKWTIVVVNNGPDAASGVKVSDVLPSGLVYRSAVASVGSYSNGVWSVGGLAKGASATLNIVTLVNKTGAVKNSASVSGNEHDYNPSNNKADKSINVKNAADLAVSKSVNNTAPNYRDLVKWTITVRNNGPDIAHNVVVGDVLPSGLVLKSSTGNYVDGKWSIDSLASGKSVSFEVVVMVNKTGTFINKVSVTADEYDYDPSNNNASSTIKVAKSADLAVTKSVNNTAPNYRDLVKWTITLRNNGPDGATGVKVSDNLPDGLVFKSYTASVGTYSDGIWTIGNLAKDVSVRLDIVCMVNKTGSIVNYATVTGNEYDVNKNNNVANKSINVAKSADLEIIKSVNNSKPRYHDLVKWTLTVRNNGPDNATDVVVKDMIPEGLIIQNAGVDYIDGKWFIGELNAFSSKTLEIITYVNKTGSFMNVATVSGYEYDYNMSNNQDNESVDVAPATDLEITKIVSNPNPDYLDDLKWILVVKNNGPDRATGVKVSEVLAQAFELKSATTVKGYYINDVWSIGDLESGEIASLEIITKVVKTGNFTNAVNVTGNEYDYDGSNNKANKSIIVNPAIDLEISKNVNITSPNYNDLVKWSITVRNNGPDKANNVEIVDLLPKGLEFVSYTSTKGHYDDGYWKFCCLESGESAKLDIISRVRAIGEIENMAMANAREYDYNPENNKDESLINVAPASDMQVTKLVNQTKFNYKQLVEWTLIVRNNGPSDATRVVVIDTLPEGLTFISAQGDGSYTATGTWYVGDVSVGQSKELKIICRADDTGKFINVAVVKADQHDYDSANNRDEKSVDVNPAADLSITKTVSKAEYNVGDVVSYLIEITNNGPDMAKNINVSEIMDDSLVVESFLAAYGDFDIDNHVWHIDSLANGEKTSLSLNAVATKDGIIANKVSAIADTFDHNLDNNYAEVIVEIIKNIIDPKNPFVPAIYSRLGDYKVLSSDFDNVVKATVEMKETGIPFALLMFVSLVLLAFSNSNISRKR